MRGDFLTDEEIVKYLDGVETALMQNMQYIVASINTVKQIRQSLHLRETGSKNNNTE